MPKHEHISKVRNGIFKRGDFWYIMYRLDGQQHRKSFGQDRKAAEIALASIKKELAVGRGLNDWTGLQELVAKPSNKTFGQAAAVYMEERASLKASTVRTYEDILKTHLLPRFGNVELPKITEEDIALFQASLLKKELAPRRVNSIIQVLRSILKVSHRRKIIKEDPSIGVDRVREPKADIDPLTFDELDLALAHIDPHFRPLFTCLAWTGARPNELLALRWGDIDKTLNKISISKGRVRGSEGLPKTRSSERQIPMLPPVVETLNELDKRSVKSAAGYVFITKDGEPIGKHLDRVWARALKKAGLRHRPSYQLRHTFASLCLLKGAQPGWVSKVLGHGSMQITFEHYLRFIETEADQNEKLMAGVFVSSQSMPERKLSK